MDEMIYSQTGRYSGRGGSGIYRHVVGLTREEKAAVDSGKLVVIDHDCPTGSQELPVRYVVNTRGNYAPRSFTSRKQAEAALRLAGGDLTEGEQKLARLA